MSAQVIYDWSVDRWARTCLNLYATVGKAEVDLRTKDLPKEFKDKLIARVQEILGVTPTEA